MTDLRLRLLFRRYVEGTISADEYYELLVLADHPANKDEFIRLIHDELIFYEQSEYENRLSVDTDEILKKVFERAASLRAGRNTKPYSGRHNTGRMLIRISVAAVIVVLLTLGINAVWERGQHKEDLIGARGKGKAETTANISPAANTAVLTLANGKQIVLDSSENGIVAQQGVSKIVNAAGKLKLFNGGARDVGIVYNTLTTHRANEYQITLSDNTKVWLNAASSVTFPNIFSGSERCISITGEAYFEVAKDSAHPFIVNVNGVAIKVLGTHFNVDAYDTKKVSTTLLEGSVQVSSGENKIFIKPGEAADVTDRRIAVHKADLDKAVAWKNGEFYFDKDPLVAIMQELSRWYDIDIHYDGAMPDNNVRYSGSIARNVELSSVLLMLHQVSNADFKIADRTVTVKL